MELYPGRQYHLTGGAMPMASYRSGSSGAGKTFDGTVIMSGMTDSEILASTGSTYNGRIILL